MGVGSGCYSSSHEQRHFDANKAKTEMRHFCLKRYKTLSRCPSTLSRTVWIRKCANSQRISLVSPTDKEKKHAFVRVQIECSFGCFQVRFRLVVSTVWIGSEYGFVILLDESASESHTQTVLGQHPKAAFSETKIHSFCRIAGNVALWTPKYSPFANGYLPITNFYRIN